MEPPLGQISFFLLCMQYARSQLENLGAKPYTAAYKAKRARRLCKVSSSEDLNGMDGYESILWSHRHISYISLNKLIGFSRVWLMHPDFIFRGRQLYSRFIVRICFTSRFDFVLLWKNVSHAWLLNIPILLFWYLTSGRLILNTKRKGILIDLIQHFTGPTLWECYVQSVVCAVWCVM